MRLVVSREPLGQILRWTQRVLVAAALSMFAYCGFVLVDGWVFQDLERRHFELLLREQRKAVATPSKIAFPALTKDAPQAATDGLLGRIEIPSLGLSLIVLEGTGRTILRRAVGHIPGTALPGQMGNVGISGHRDTFFRPLRNIRKNDTITLTTLAGDFRYRVVSMKVVTPEEIGVLDAGASEILTLVTCYPFYFVGAAPDRFIVRAERLAD